MFKVRGFKKPRVWGDEGPEHWKEKKKNRGMTLRGLER